MQRRAFLFSATTAALSAADEGRAEIASVRAARIPFRPASDFGHKRFTSDTDPARRRWFGPFSQLTGAILVRVDTVDGLTGWGLGGGGSAALHIIDRHLRDLLIGVDALDPQRIWQQMYDSSSFYGRRGLAIMAISGIDLALWDILGKHRQQPVQELIGEDLRERIPGYYTGDTVKKGVDLGFQAFKIPIRETHQDGEAGMKRALERLRAIRRTIGTHAKLMIDCLARWDVPYTLEFAERAQELNLEFIEEPLYPYDIEGYRRICREVRGTRIASGEHEYALHGFRELVRNEAAHILQPDVTWSGGISGCLPVAELAEKHGLPLIPHRGGSPYGLALIAACPHCPMAESFGTGEEDNELWQAFTAQFKDGFYQPVKEPGFGVHLSRSLIEKHVPTLA